MLMTRGTSIVVELRAADDDVSLAAGVGDAVWHDADVRALYSVLGD